MKKILIFISILLISPIDSYAQTSDDINNSILLFCNTGNGKYQKEVTVERGDRIYLNQGSYSQIQQYDIVDVDKELLKNILGKMNSGEKCFEYLLSNSSIERDDTTARVYFNFDNSKLTSASIYILNKLIENVKASKSNYLIEGHTDSVGTTSYNEDLGYRRAKSVIEFFVGNGVNRSQLQGMSEGELKPLETNDTSIGRSYNRRVEIKKL